MQECRPFSRRRSTAGAALGVALALACVERSDDLGATGSETHFLIECSETCAAGLDCIAGVCTSPCTSDEICASWSSAAACTAQPGAGEPGVCDIQCSVAADCSSLGAGYRCEAGACRSATSVGTDIVTKSVPETFEVLEYRRMMTREPAVGSDCDPTDLSEAYFIELAAGRVSWVRCEPLRYRSNVWRRLAGSWMMDDAARDDLLAAYRQLQGGISESCVGGGGGTFVDVTTAESARFSYGDESFVPCEAARYGRMPIANLGPLSSALVQLSADSYVEATRADSADR